MSRIARAALAANNVNVGLANILNRFQPGLSQIYQRLRSKSSTSGKATITYIPLKTDLPTSIITTDLQKLLSQTRMGNKVSGIDLENPTTLQASSKDITLKEWDGYSEILIGSKEGLQIDYGDTGIAPSEEINVSDLLKHKFDVPEGLGVLEVKNNTPFSIKSDPTQSFAITESNLQEVQEYNRSKIERIASLKKITGLTEDTARMLHIRMQESIFGDPAKEKFYEEVTSIIRKPTISNPSSTTLMNFERQECDVDNTTDSHYHPGDRILLIFTIGKKAGVTLNFCGINENPDERKDCEMHFDFQKDSISELHFPAYTHHKFHGDFLCASIHPEDGPNMIKAVNSGTLESGFLESATVFSSTDTTNKVQQEMKGLISKNHSKRGSNSRGR